MFASACTQGDGSDDNLVVSDAVVTSTTRPDTPETPSCGPAVEADAWSGRFAETSPRGRAEGSFTRWSDGSYVIDYTYPSGERSVTTFDASTGMSRGSVGGMKGFGIERRGQAIDGAYARTVLLESYLHVSLARSVTASGPAQDGRFTYVVTAEEQLRAWPESNETAVANATVSGRVHSGAGIACVVEVAQGGFTTTVEVTDLKPYSGDRSVLSLPPTGIAMMKIESDGFRPMTLDEVTRAAPYRLAFGSDKPLDFVLAWAGYSPRVATAAGDRTDVTTLVYRQGRRTFTVTQAAATGAETTDPYRPVDVTGAKLGDVRKVETAVPGLSLTMVTALGTTPHVWGDDGTSLISIGGDLTTDELQQLAQLVGR
jgi:hypothetical protein